MTTLTEAQPQSRPVPGWFKGFPHGYRLALRAVVALPLVAAAVFAIEFAQHVAEVHIGMYDSLAQASATEAHPLRMGFGYVKMLVLLLAAYPVTRFVATGDARFAMRGDGWRTFAPFLALQILLTAAHLAFVPADQPGVFLAAFLASQLLAALLAPWAVAAAVGNSAIGLWRSVQIMAPQIVPAFAFMFLFMLPPMVLHYGFAAFALLGPPVLLWPALVLDSVLVVYLAAVLPVSGWIVAGRAARRAGADLIG